MKHLILLITFLFIGCKPASTESKKEISTEVTSVLKCPDPIVIRDTVFAPKQIIDTKKYDSLIGVIKKKNDSLFIERYRLERVKYYNGIVQRNPIQIKFLVGWINRAVK